MICYEVDENEGTTDDGPNTSTPQVPMERKHKKRKLSLDSAEITPGKEAPQSKSKILIVLNTFYEVF